MRHDRHHHGINPSGRPIELCVRVERVQGRGALVTLLEDRGQEKFWLPATWPVEWPTTPAAGDIVTIRLPRWLATKHRPVVALRVGGQASLSSYFNPPPPLGLEASKKGSMPMADDRPQDAGKGFLARNDRREKPSHPEFTGKLSINGREYRLAAWVREKDGRKFFSIAANEIEQRPAEQQSADRPSFERRIDDAIPF